MTTPAELRTGYALPFRVQLPDPRRWSDGGNLEAVLRAAGSPGAVELLPGILDLFGRLARSGALAGGAVDPATSGLQPGPVQVEGAGAARFSLKGCRVDPSAAVVLAHLLLARQAELQVSSLEIPPGGGSLLAADPDETSTYPARARLPFTLEDEKPDSGAYAFTIEFEQPLGPEEESALKKLLNVWVEAVLAGAWALAPIPPEESYVEPPDDGLVTYGTTAEWSVAKLRADDPAIDGLLNLLAVFHGRTRKLVSVLIS